MNRYLLLASATLALAATTTAGFLLGRHAFAPHADADAKVGPSKPVLYWYDPMLPDQHFPAPGLSPMGMQMVPRYADGPMNDDGAVRIDPATRQNLGWRTARVVRRRLDDRLDVPATVRWNADEVSTVSARADGVIDDVRVTTPFATVQAGDTLARLLAPAWSSAMAEDAALAQARSADAQSLRHASQQRLRTLGIVPADVRTTAGPDGSVALLAAHAGIVTAVQVQKGQRVTAGQTLFTINGRDTVWVEAEVPPSRSLRIRAGMPVDVRIEGDSVPHAATVQAVLPDVDAITRYQRVRIVLPNPRHIIAPGMFAKVSIHVIDDTLLPTLPDEALIDDGKASHVIVDEGTGRFRPVSVTTGRSAGGYTQVTTGLSGGERVVVSGQFLLDSEASLSGSLQRMDAPAPEATP